jgi:VanZ family protein
MGQKSDFKQGGHPRQAPPAGQAGRRSLLSRREARGALAIAIALISVVALLPGAEGRPTLIGWDKLDHVASFIALTLLARAGWPKAARWRTAAPLFAYGVLIELLQSTDFVGRTASVSDAAANAIGIALGLAVALWLGRLSRTLAWLPMRR